MVLEESAKIATNEELVHISFQDTNLLKKIDIKGKIYTILDNNISRRSLIINHPYGFDIHIDSTFYEKVLSIKIQYYIEYEHATINNTIKDMLEHTPSHLKRIYTLSFSPDDISCETSIILNEQLYHLTNAIINISTIEDNYIIKTTISYPKAVLVCKDSQLFNEYKKIVLSNHESQPNITRTSLSANECPQDIQQNSPMISLPDEKNEKVMDICFQDFHLHKKTEMNIDIEGKITISDFINECSLIIHHPYNFNIYIHSTLCEKGILKKEQYQKNKSDITAEKKEINDMFKDILQRILLNEKIKYKIIIPIKNIKYKNLIILDYQYNYLITVGIIFSDIITGDRIKVYFPKAVIEINNHTIFNSYKNILTDDKQRIFPSKIQDSIALQKDPETDKTLVSETYEITDPETDETLVSETYEITDPETDEIKDPKTSETIVQKTDEKIAPNHP